MNKIENISTRVNEQNEEQKKLRAEYYKLKSRQRSGAEVSP